MSVSRSHDLRFAEIEHKFVVDDRFDLDRFRHDLNALGPKRTTSLRVLDTYYLLTGSRAQRFVVRHRYDDELHHLTVKSVGGDTEVREEVNIDLGHHQGNQRAQVDAFLGRLGVEWSGSLQKDLHVWDFSEIEVVHYTASTADRTVRCVEFEATRKESLSAALEIVHRYEQATGFDATTRSHRSLLQLLFPDVVTQLA